MGQSPPPSSSGVRRRPGNDRITAARVIAAVLGGRSLAATLPAALQQAHPEDRARVQNLCYGTLRWTPQLRAILGRLQKKPMDGRNRELEAVLLMGLFELIHTRTPDHAAVSESVDCARRLRVNRRALGFTNAVLRQYLRRREALEAELAADAAAAHAHPAWLLGRIQAEWPDDWTGIVRANNTQAPMTLRVALDRISRDQYLELLGVHDINASPHEQVPSAVVLEKPQTVMALPGFSEGLVSVQDAAAQLAAGLLDLQPGARVLDACAAPGGKTGHILESQPRLDALVAIDSEGDRLARLADNLDRLQRRALPLRADVRATSRWWDGRPFDRILLDAPCTASGVIRRHPDIKLLRRPEDSKTLAETQQQLLAAVWSTLAPGGKIIYATCSIFGDENQGVINAFLAEHDEAEKLCLERPWGRWMGAGRQILPGECGMDGFFYGALGKRPK